jgi:hypothetical protein
MHTPPLRANPSLHAQAGWSHLTTSVDGTHGFFCASSPQVTGQAEAQETFTSGSTQETVGMNEDLTIAWAFGTAVGEQFSSSFGRVHSRCPSHIVAQVASGVWQAIFPILVHICVMVVGAAGVCGGVSALAGVHSGIATEVHAPASQWKARQSFLTVWPVG